MILKSSFVKVLRASRIRSGGGDKKSKIFGGAGGVPLTVHETMVIHYLYVEAEELSGVLSSVSTRLPGSSRFEEEEEPLLGCFPAPFRRSGLCPANGI
jgi:hypothetical protein